jgi:hypothetical protein
MIMKISIWRKLQRWLVPAVNMRGKRLHRLLAINGGVRRMA